MFDFVFLFRQVKFLQNIFSRKFLITNAFKHVQLQYTLNRCKGYQILLLTIDYGCFLVKCINYQNVMCLQINYFWQETSFFFLQEMSVKFPCKIGRFLARFFRETCKTFLAGTTDLYCHMRPFLLP